MGENRYFAFFSSLTGSSKPPSLKFGNVCGFYVCRPPNELCFHFIFYRLCVCVLVLRVCLVRPIRIAAHKIYNNSFGQFRKQHHTRQSQLWNELTICFCKFAFMLSRSNKMRGDGWIWWNKTKHTHQMNSTFVRVQCLPCSRSYSDAVFSLLLINEFLFIDFAKVHTYFSLLLLLLTCSRVYFCASAAMLPCFFACKTVCEFWWSIGFEPKQHQQK